MKLIKGILQVFIQSLSFKNIQRLILPVISFPRWFRASLKHKSDGFQNSRELSVTERYCAVIPVTSMQVAATIRSLLASFVKLITPLRRSRTRNRTSTYFRGNVDYWHMNFDRQASNSSCQGMLRLELDIGLWDTWSMAKSHPVIKGNL